MSQSPQEAADTTNSLKKGNRGLSWSVEEDEQLCRSWSDINIGGETGILSMWDRIRDEFYAKVTPKTQRSASSMKSRWHIIQASTMKFCEAVAEAETQITSDTENGNLRMTEAFKIYRRNAKFNEGFNLQHCWTILRDKEKWKTMIAKKQAKDAKIAVMVSNATPAPTDNSVLQEQQQQQQQQQPTQVHITTQQPQTQTQQLTQPQPQTQGLIQPRMQPYPLQIQQEQPSNPYGIILPSPKKRKLPMQDSEYNKSKLKLKERKLDIQIMTFDPLQFPDPVRREFFEIQQKEVLYRWKKIMANDNQQQQHEEEGETS